MASYTVGDGGETEFSYKEKESLGSRTGERLLSPKR